MNQLRLLITLVLILLLAISSQAGRATYGETRIPLNGFWQFKTDPLEKGEQQQWYSSGFNDAGWDKMEVPGSWELMNETANYIGKAWYRTTFKTPENSVDRRFFLEFEAVSMSYKVYLNGQLVAKQLVGNYNERYDVSAFIQKSGENNLAVEIDNRLTWGAYTNWGGIRRPVTLCVVEPVIIERQEVVSVPDLNKGTAEVNVRVFIRNHSAKEQTVICLANLEYDGKPVTKSLSMAVKVPAHGSENTSLKFKLPKAQTRLWHFDHPNLYTSEVTLLDGDRKLSSYADRFGIRKIELDGYQFKLNGEPVRLAGFNWVADDRTTGNTLPTWRYKEDIDRMKSLGANMARLSHRPLTEEVMDYLDEKGIMVVSEFNNWAEFINPDSPEPREFAAKLIRQQYNHPCIVGWSVGNEMGDQKSNVSVNGYVESMIRFIKQKLDSTRFVLYVSNSADWQENDAAKFCDFIMINKYDFGMGYEKAIDALKTRYPGKPVFMSEYGSHTASLIYDTPNKTRYTTMIADKFSGKENLFGFAVWTYNDYRSTYQSPNPATTTPMHQNRQWGCVDDYRNKKRAFEQMRDLYAPVRSLEVKTTANGNMMLINLALQPRSPLDIPAFRLQDYRLIWEVRAKNGTTQQGGIVKLPEIVPGDKSLNYTADFAVNGESALLKVSLLSSTGYNVKDTILYLTKPAPPKILAVIQASRAVRVVFEKNEFATEYLVKYTSNGVTKMTPPTFDHYIDLAGLPADLPCELSVVGTNGAGEGEPSSPVTILPGYGARSLPPVVWLTEACNNGCTIGQSYNYTDQFYEVKYGWTPEEEGTWRQVSSRVFGAFRVSELENGRRYYLRIRSVPQGGGVPSEWSEMLTATPGRSALQGEAAVNGVIQQGGEFVLSIHAAKNASGYVITYETGGRLVEERVAQSAVEYVLLRKTDKKGVKNLTIKAL
jgi:beta-galactosidase